MLVQERGGNGGLGARDLHLFSVISPEWAIPGREVAIRNAPTDVGPISAVMKFTGDGAVVTLASAFRTQPARIVLHIPYFVKLSSFTSDAEESKLENGAVTLSPDVSTVSLKWTKDAQEPLSYSSVVEDYKREYARRYAEYTAAGKKPMRIEAPKLLTAAERKASFDSKWGAEVVGIAVGKPVTVSGGTEHNHVPERAVDGNADDRDGSSWWAGPPTPRRLQIDLQKPVLIDRVQVFPYWDAGRYYQYTVQVSQDGESWEQVADWSKNTKPATPKGDLHKFEATKVRYVRVNMLHNSANTSVHLVEVRVFPAK